MGVYKGVKFGVEFIEKIIPVDPKLEELKIWCNKFHESGLTPFHETGTFGNLSFRTENNKFIITGSAIVKGGLDYSCFVKVLDYNKEKRIVHVRGTRNPSSEAVFHLRIYEQRPDISAIFHGHCEEILKNAKKLNIPVTEVECPYGTVELANEVLKLSKDHNFFIMKNHGFVALGKTMKEAGNISLQYLEKCKGD